MGSCPRSERTQRLRRPLGPLLFNGEASVQEWIAMTSRSDSSTVSLRGTSVRRFVDGLVAYAADYYDTAPLTPST
jgi:hypothetical protein